MDLQELRQQIDAVDNELIDLFRCRMELAAQVADYKQSRGLPILDAAREQEKLQTLCGKTHTTLQPALRDLYTTIFHLSRRHQQQRQLRCGLLGQHLSHSYSPRIHNLLAAYSYELFQVQPQDLEEFLRSGSWDGLNVTMPYKKAVLPFCDRLSPLAAELGSVNTLVRCADGTIFGDNTDACGFSVLLSRLPVDVRGKQALVLGSGGASVTVQAVLRKLGAEVTVISRTGSDNYETLPLHKNAALLVNATPVGMYPDNGACLVNLDHLPRLEAVVDLVYNPARTKLLLEAQRRHILCMGGLPMLVAQAAKAAELFTAMDLCADTVSQTERIIGASMENLILIGMPGCGKTTVGRELAQRTGRTFLDADAVLESRIGSIRDFLETHGEDAFRVEETKVLAELGKGSCLVIATGGGCVTRQENYDLLHQNGVIIRLLRDLDKLTLENKPLSQKYGVQILYDQRKEAYERFADMTVDHNGEAEETVEEILHRRTV